MKKEKEEITYREEANALIRLCVRDNTPLEDYHAKGTPIGQEEMKSLMIASTKNLAHWLKKRDEEPQKYKQFIKLYIPQDWET